MLFTTIFFMSFNFSYVVINYFVSYFFSEAETLSTKLQSFTTLKISSTRSEATSVVAEKTKVDINPTTISAGN